MNVTPSASTSARLSEIRICVDCDATACLDLVLGDAGLRYREIATIRTDTSVVIELADSTTVDHIIAVLRQHLGPMLRCASTDCSANPSAACSHARRPATTV